jgi:GT2 family glycosyltransferase
VGPFRTAVSEDKEWCLRARDLGFRIAFAPDAVVGHPARRDWLELRTKWRRIMAESFALTLERGGGQLGWLLRTWALIPSIPVHMARIITTSALSHPAHRMSAIATLVRLRLWRFVEGHRLLLARKA